MWENQPELAALLRRVHPDIASERALLEAAFGPLCFIHLSRTDKLRQAMSLLKAAQSGLWHMGADGTVREQDTPSGAVAFDADRIAAVVSELTSDDEAWRGWFAAQGIEPVGIIYESLSGDPPATLATVLAALGLDPALAAGIKPRTAKLADAATEAWVEQYGRR